MSKQNLAYGLWPSPISPISLAQSLRLSDLAWDCDTSASASDDSPDTLVWLEGRSARGVLVTRPMDAQAPRDLTSDLSVRARVGYGGGDMTVSHGTAFFAAEGRLYRQCLQQGEAKAITTAFGDAASPAVSPDGRWVMYVHTAEEVDRLAIVDAQGSHWPQILAEGDDFYMQPTWHPDGQQVAWISWKHPLMPWDGTQLHLAKVTVSDSGCSLSDDTVLAGDDNTSIFQPAFAPNGRWLLYASDASGWYNLYLYDLASGETRLLVEDQAELAMPAWAQGMRCYAWTPDSASVYYRRSHLGQVKLYRVNVADGVSELVAELAEYTNIQQVTVSPQGTVAAIASSAKIPARVVALDPTIGQVQVLAHSAAETVPAEQLSPAQPIAWPTTEDDTAFGLLYMPVDTCESAEAKPPLIVHVHGGPTSQAVERYDGMVQFFTTRGYAVLEVNYRGSTGYGREYRNKLREQWGLRDVDDCATGAQYLAAQGLVDPGRLVIMGGSAGGYAVLQALIRYPGVFKAGLCLYGVTNLFTLASDTHKFEARYLDSMVGPLPETAQRYHDRSPIFFADRIQDPVAVFQGEIDRVVPQAQAETIVAALRRSGVPHEYHLYPGEGHGWRKSETIEQFYNSVLSFLKQYVIFA